MPRVAERRRGPDVPTDRPARQQQRVGIVADVFVQVVLDVGADVRRHHHRAALARLRGVDVAAAGVVDPRATVMTSALSLMSLRRSSPTSPQRSPHHAAISASARYRAG